MTEADWVSDTASYYKLFYNRFARDPRKRRLFGCACARRALGLIGGEPRAAALVAACERYADAGADGPGCWKAVVAARKAVRQLILEYEGNPDLRTSRAVRFDYRPMTGSEGWDYRVWAATTVYNAATDSPSKIGSAPDFYSRAIQLASERPAPPPGPLPPDDRCLPLFRDVFGNPFRPVTFSPGWRTSTAVAIARGMYESWDFSAMPILADALQDAGCENEDILNHCRDASQVHVRGCWVVDLVLGKS